MGTTVREWAQPPLFDPDVVEITLTVGVVKTGDHVQWQLEVRSPTDGELLAMESCPHAPMAHVAIQVAEACRRFEAAVLASSWPV